MTAWQTSRSKDRRHKHTPVKDSKGQMVCSACRQIVIDPIMSSDDERLRDAGLQRTPKPDQEEFWGPFPCPLTIQLIVMYNKTEGEFPVAPYMLDVQQEHLTRCGGDYIPQDLWERLANKV